MAEKLGLPAQDARKQLDDLLAERKTIHDLFRYKGYHIRTSGGTSAEELELQSKLEDVEKRIAETRELYGTNLLESLYFESKKLSSLTRALIGLTAILAILTFLLLLGTFK